MLHIEEPDTGIPARRVVRGRRDGDALLFVGVLVGSWVIAVGVGWVIWRLSPL